MKKILLAFLLMSFIIFSLQSCGNSSDKNGTTDTESVSAKDKFIYDENFDNAARVLKTDSDLEYAILTTIYYYDGDGSLFAVKQTAEYQDQTKADFDYSVMSAMSDYFSEYSQDGLNLYCTVAEDAIEKNFSDSDYNSVIDSARENSLKYEILK